MVRLMTSFQAYRQAVSKDIKTLNRLNSKVLYRIEVSMNELNRDTVVMHSDITLLR